MSRSASGASEPCGAMQADNPVFAEAQDLEASRNKAGADGLSIEVMEARLEAQAQKVLALEAKLDAYMGDSSLESTIHSAVARLTEAPT